MKKLHLFKTVLLLCALIVGSGSAWADTVTFTAGTDTSEGTSITKGGITITFSNGVFNRTDNYRCYSGASMTISSSVGNMTQIDFTATGSNPMTKFSGDPNVGSWTDNNKTRWTGNASTIDFGTTSGQCRMTQIVVTYTAAAKTDPTITFSNGSVRVGKTLDLSTLFTSNSSGAVTYSITSGDSYASLDGSTLTGDAKGSVTVKAEQAAAGSYNAGEASATITVNAALGLSSIAITTAPTKTTYTEGETFDPTGMVVTATYSDASTDDVTASCTYSPSGALSTSDTEITISYTEGVTKTATQAITVNPYVQPTTVTFNITQSMFEGVTFNASNQTSEESISTTVDNVEMTINKGTSNTYVKDGEFRCYKNGTLVFEAPSNYVMTKIVFTKGSSWNMNEADSGVLSSQTWTGEASDVTFSFTGRTDITKVVVTLMEVEEVTMNAAGYATFASTKPLDLTDLPEGLTAYKAKVSGANVTFSPIEQEISANTGILLGGVANKTYYIPVADSGTSVDGNEFQVNTSGSTFFGTPSKLYFALKKSADVLLFGTFDPASLAIPANKAYLIVNESAFETPARELIISFEDGETTGVVSVAKPQSTQTAEYFNLNGQRVAQPTKGLYIVNGKKVVIK